MKPIDGLLQLYQENAFEWSQDAMNSEIFQKMEELVDRVNRNTEMCTQLSVTMDVVVDRVNILSKPPKPVTYAQDGDSFQAKAEFTRPDDVDSQKDEFLEWLEALIKRRADAHAGYQDVLWCYEKYTSLKSRETP